MFFIDELFNSTIKFEPSLTVIIIQFMGYPTLVSLQKKIFFKMVRTEVGLITVTEDNLDIEIFLCESTTALTFSTFSAM